MDLIAAVRAVFEEGWNHERFEALEPLFGETFTLHIGETDRSMTMSELSAIVRRWHEGFPDLRFEIHGRICLRRSGSRPCHVAGHTRWPVGRSRGDREIDLGGAHVLFRVEGDRLVEVWELLDRDALRSQLSEV
jgi:predicted ester cyclase